jgi:hypothetical protein
MFTSSSLPTRLLASHRKPHVTAFIQLTVLLHALAVYGQSTNLIINGSFEQGSFVADENQSMSLDAESKTLAGWTIANQVQWITTPNP